MGWLGKWVCMVFGIRGHSPSLEVLEPTNYKVPAPKPRVGSEGSLSGLFGKE